MEEDRWDDLPGRAYARGFLTTYADYLGLDASLLTDAFMRGPGKGEGSAPIPEEMLPRRGELKRHAVPPRLLAALAGAVALAAVVVLIAILSASSDGGRGLAQPGGDEPASEAPAGAATTAAVEDEGPAEAPEPSKARLVLRPTSDVWVCLVRDDGRVLIAGETLPADEPRGPFNGRRFELGLGNGSVRMTVNGERVPIAPDPNPLGYRIGPGGADELPPAERPECV